MRHYFRMPLISAAAIAIGVFLVSQPAAAGFGQAVASVLTAAWYYLFIVGLGQLVTMLMGLVIDVASYNGFLNSQAVQLGWPLVRDLANMFFVVALLIIAVGTIFGSEQYRWTRLLPRFVAMAVLINFSKGIAGLLIDFSQVVTLTFVNAFKDVSIANFTEGFGLTKLVSFSGGLAGSTVEASFGEVLVGVILGGIMMFVSALVLLAILVIFVIRMLAFWVLIILSPLAFMLTIFANSKAKGYATRWWEEMARYMIVGPMVAFFMWLAFSIVQTYASQNTTIGAAEIKSDGGAINVGDTAGAKIAEELTVGLVSAGESHNILSFIVFVALLLLGLKEAVSSGVEGAGFAGRMYGKFSAGELGKWGTGNVLGLRFPRNVALGKAGRWGARQFGKHGFTGGFGLGALGAVLSAPRTVQKAWEQRKLEEERVAYPWAQGRMQDAFNRIFSLGGKRTSYATEHLTGAIAERQKSMEAGEFDAAEFTEVFANALFSKDIVEKQAAQRVVISGNYQDDMNQGIADLMKRGKEGQGGLAGKLYKLVEKMDPTGKKYEEMRKGTTDVDEFDMFMRDLFFANTPKEVSSSLALNAVGYAEANKKIRGLGYAHLGKDKKTGKAIPLWSSELQLSADDLKEYHDVTGKVGEEDEIVDLLKMYEDAAKAGDAAVMVYAKEMIGKNRAFETRKRMRRGTPEPWMEDFNALVFRKQHGSDDPDQKAKGTFGELTESGKQILRTLPAGFVNAYIKSRRTSPRSADIIGFTPYTEKQLAEDLAYYKFELGDGTDEYKAKEKALTESVGGVIPEAVKPEMMFEVQMIQPELTKAIFNKLALGKDDVPIVKRKIKEFIDAQRLKAVEDRVEKASDQLLDDFSDFANKLEFAQIK